MSDYPKHLASSQREWKSMKRRELREVLKDGSALDDLFLGCAYTPACKEIVQARELLKTAKKNLSVKNWGR